MLRIIKNIHDKKAADQEKTRQIIANAFKPDPQSTRFISLETQQKINGVYDLFQEHEPFYNKSHAS